MKSKIARRCKKNTKKQLKPAPERIYERSFPKDQNFTKYFLTYLTWYFCKDPWRGSPTCWLKKVAGWVALLGGGGGSGGGVLPGTGLEMASTQKGQKQPKSSLVWKSSAQKLRGRAAKKLFPLELLPSMGSAARLGAHSKILVYFFGTAEIVSNMNCCLYIIFYE